MRSYLEVEGSDELHSVSSSATTDSVSNDEVECEVEEYSSRDFLARFFPFLGSTGIRHVSIWKVSATTSDLRSST